MVDRPELSRLWSSERAVADGEFALHLDVDREGCNSPCAHLHAVAGIEEHRRIGAFERAGELVEQVFARMDAATDPAIFISRTPNNVLRGKPTVARAVGLAIAMETRALNNNIAERGRSEHGGLAAKLRLPMTAATAEPRATPLT